jgi:hypothetical protein
VERSGTWGKAPPRNQSLGKATHESAPTMRLKNKEKVLAYVSSFVAVCPRCQCRPPPGLRPCGRRHPRFRSASHSSTWGYSWYCLAEANQRANPSVCLYAWASGDVSHNTHHYFPCTIQWKQLNACAASPGLICFALSALLLLRGNVNAAALMMVESTTRMLFIWRERGHL